MCVRGLLLTGEHGGWHVLHVCERAADWGTWMAAGVMTDAGDNEWPLY